MLANQQAFSHEQASFRMQIFCSLNTLRDQYGGFLHERLRAYKRLCNVNAALRFPTPWKSTVFSRAQIMTSEISRKSTENRMTERMDFRKYDLKSGKSTIVG